MCELFGLSSSLPINVTPYLKQLQSHSTDHPHGWGMAVFKGPLFNLEKEARTAWVSDYLNCRLNAPIEAASLISHIRLATRGGMSYANCHPFVQADNTGRVWTLAHNGTIFESELLDDYKSVQTGSTDSERILCHLIERINRSSANRPLSAEERFEIMDRIILEIAEHNKINLLIYDGELLYVHTNMEGTLYQKQIEEGILFATVPYEDKGWEPVPMKQLLAFNKGRLQFAGTIHSFEYRLPDPDVIYNKGIGL